MRLRYRVTTGAGEIIYLGTFIDYDNGAFTIYDGASVVVHYAAGTYSSVQVMSN